MKLIFKTLTAMICTLVLWEVILENTVEKSPGSTAHPVLGRITKAGIAVQGAEGFSRTRINSLGMREENILPKRANEYRILMLGDSFTKGIHVADDKTYTYLTQKILRSKCSSNIRAINAGRDGASPAFYLHLASFYKSLIKPDSVTIQLRNGNIEDMLDDKKQFYVRQQKKAFTTVYNQNALSDNLLSQIFLHKFPQLSFMLEYSVLRIGGKNLQEIISGHRLNTDESAPPLKQSSLNTENALIDWTVKDLSNKYSKALLLYIPDLNYGNLAEPPSNVEVSLTNSANKQGVNFINMRQDFVQYYQTHHQPAFGFNNTVPGKGHINETGHALIAERLADYLERILK